MVLTATDTVQWHRRTEPMPDGRVKVTLIARKGGQILGEIRQLARVWLWVEARYLKDRADEGVKLSPGLEVLTKRCWLTAAEAKDAIEKASSKQ